MLKILSPTTKKHPVVISVPHAGTVFPDKTIETLVNQDPLLITRDSDLYVDELYHKAPELGATMLVYPFCRYVIDPNRDPKKVDASFVQGAPVVDNPQFIGLVSHKTTRGEQLLKQPISPNDLQYRIQNYYQPFHDNLTRLIKETKNEFGFCIHIDAHSMPSKASAGHEDKGLRADVVPGNLYGKSCSDKLTNMVIEHFESSGLSVNLNNPYQGGFITQHYGQPQNNVHTLQLELNRKLYMNETTHDKLNGDFEKLKDILTQLVQKIVRLSL